MIPDISNAITTSLMNITWMTTSSSLVSVIAWGTSVLAIGALAACRCLDRLYSFRLWMLAPGRCEERQHSRVVHMSFLLSWRHLLAGVDSFPSSKYTDQWSLQPCKKKCNMQFYWYIFNTQVNQAAQTVVRTFWVRKAWSYTNLRVTYVGISIIIKYACYNSHSSYKVISRVIPPPMHTERTQ